MLTLNALPVLERRNPLPVGRYWADVLEPHIPALNAWTSGHRGDVKTRTTEYYAPVSATIFSDAQPGRQWILFDVVKPTTWDAAALGGLPNIVSQSAQNSSTGIPVNTGVQYSQDTTSNSPDDASPDYGKLILVGLGFVALLLFAQGREERQGRARL